MNEQNAGFWDSVLIGETIEKYQIEEFLGRGGFGIVLRATHVETARPAAIKVLSPSAGGDDAFEFKNEGELFRRLAGCTGVVTMIGTGDYSHTFKIQNGPTIPWTLSYHILELADGDLEELVLNRHRLDWLERLRLWRQVILGVHQMHLRQVVHRDLKSQNCLLFLLPKNQMTCKVTDFGRSRYLPSRPRHSPQEYLVGRGDGRFAPPEFLTWQGEGNRDSHISADLYGLGAILFELATGEPITEFTIPYDGEVMRANLELIKSGQKIDLSGMRSHFEGSYKLFETSLPAEIRKPLGDLLRKLCDPEPSARLPKPKLSQKTLEPGLNWLLTRADILIRTLDTHDAKRIRSKNHRGGL